MRKGLEAVLEVALVSAALGVAACSSDSDAGKGTSAGCPASTAGAQAGCPAAAGTTAGCPAAAGTTAGCPAAAGATAGCPSQAGNAN